MDLPSYRWRFAHLAALWAYGVGQPVFSMLKANPEFLVVRGSTRWDVMVFSLLLVVVPPLAVVATEALASLFSYTLAGALHILAIWSFSFLAALQLVRLLDPERGAALLLPMVPAALAAIAYLRWRAFRSFLSVSLVLPLIGLLGFVATVPLAVDDAAGANVPVTTRIPVVLVVFDEFPVSSLMRADGSLDTVRYPNFATSRARRHVVPAGDHGARLHDARGPGDPHGAAPTEGRAADAEGSPGQPLHLAGRPVRASCQRAGDPALSVALLPTDTL